MTMKKLLLIMTITFSFSQTLFACENLELFHTINNFLEEKELSPNELDFISLVKGNEERPTVYTFIKWGEAKKSKKYGTRYLVKVSEASCEVENFSIKEIKAQLKKVVRYEWEIQ